MEYDEERDGGGERGASAGAPRDRTEGAAETGPTTLTAKAYERELARLQIELAKLQEWIRVQGLKVVVIFEGRDAAGKGGAIKRITESLNPRSAGWWRWARRRSASERSGISSAMWRISRQVGRWPRRPVHASGGRSPTASLLGRRADQRPATPCAAPLPPVPSRRRGAAPGRPAAHTLQGCGCTDRRTSAGRRAGPAPARPSPTRTPGDGRGCPGRPRCCPRL